MYKLHKFRGLVFRFFVNIIQNLVLRKFLLDIMFQKCNNNGVSCDMLRYAIYVKLYSKRTKSCPFYAAGRRAPQRLWQNSRTSIRSLTIIQQQKADIPEDINPLEYPLLRIASVLARWDMDIGSRLCLPDPMLSCPEALSECHRVNTLGLLALCAHATAKVDDLQNTNTDGIYRIRQK